MEPVRDCTAKNCGPETPCPECSGEAAREREAVLAPLREPLHPRPVRAVFVGRRRRVSLELVVEDLARGWDIDVELEVLELLDEARTEAARNGWLHVEPVRAPGGAAPR